MFCSKSGVGWGVVLSGGRRGPIVDTGRLISGLPSFTVATVSCDVVAVVTLGLKENCRDPIVDGFVTSSEVENILLLVNLEGDELSVTGSLMSIRIFGLNVILPDLGAKDTPS